MAGLEDKLRGQGINLRRWRPGNHKTLCPKCSHTRRKAKDPCLSVTVQADRALIHCHNCGWSTAVFEDDADGRKTVGRRDRMGRRSGHQRLDLGTARRRERYGQNAP